MFTQESLQKCFPYSNIDTPRLFTPNASWGVGMLRPGGVAHHSCTVRYNPQLFNNPLSYENNYRSVLNNLHPTFFFSDMLSHSYLCLAAVIITYTKFSQVVLL